MTGDGKNGRWVAGGRDPELSVRWLTGRTQDGRHCADLEVPGFSVSLLKNFFGGSPQKGVRAQRAPQAPHDHRRLQAVTGDIACHQPKLARGERKQVVPVAAHSAVRWGEVSSREFQTGTNWHLVEQQTSFQKGGRGALLVQLAPLDSPGHALSNDFEQLGISVIERTVLKATHMEDPYDTLPGEQGHAKHHPDASFPQDRIRYGRRVDSFQQHWMFLNGNATGEPDTHRHPHPFANLIFDAARCARY
jgi:hypothetical protein